jgi:hypothetical protein
VARASSGDRARAISTIVSAFVHDPVERWLLTDSDNLELMDRSPA